ncbi:hypothetical protein Dimus_018050 [Dionaea muscipula]
MTVSHLKKRDVIKSSVKGISIEIDHERLATILGVPGRNGICEYIKGVWEESSGGRRARCETPAAPAVPASSSAQQKDKEPSGVDPSGPTGREAEFLKFQAEFERKRANQFHDDLEKAKAENARLLALLHQA